VLGGARNATLIEVDLAPYQEAAGTAQRLQILHPVALDAAFHAMFDDLKPRPGVRYAYLPVRFATLRVFTDHAIPARARVAVDRETDQSLSVTVTLFDSRGATIAALAGGLFRAVVLERHAQERVFYDQHTIRLSRSGDPAARRARAVQALAGIEIAETPESWLYLGAFARSLAFQSLRQLHGTSAISHGAATQLTLALLADLTHAGLATRTPFGWTLAADSGLPPPLDILHSLAAEYPAASADIVLAANALAALPRALATGEDQPLSPAAVEQFETTSILLSPVLRAAATICAALHGAIPTEPLRVLVAEPFSAGVLHSLASLVHDGRVTVTVLGVDARRLAQAEARHTGTTGVSFLAVDPDSAPEAAPRFDVAFCLALAPLLSDGDALGRALAQRLAASGLLCILQPPASPIFDCLLGAQPDWFEHAPFGRIAAARDGKHLATAAGLRDVQTRSLGADAGSIVLAAAPASSADASDLGPIILLRDWPGLASVLRGRGLAVRTQTAADRAITTAATLIYSANREGPASLAGAMADLAAILPAAQATSSRLWIVVRGLRGAAAQQIDPAAEAIWSFARVAMNEFPGIDLKLVDAALTLSDAEATEALGALIAAPGPAAGAETELLLDAAGVAATRLRAAPPATARVEAARLQPSATAGFAQSGFDWVESARRAPDAGEIEIEVTAAGLNFRDVMLASGLLDDDVLDDGLAGAVLGFECAGRVLRTGSAISHLRPGDAVMGFGRESFATHLTADARVFIPVPEGIDTAAAATIPVAFLTAWYALVHLARLQPGEWVLIHGAAGGVGLAALQIARLRGARIAATVSTPEKRAIVAAFGAEKIYHSRSTAFLDELRADTGGVDVVLNSLAGDAMQASLKCLKPFGRFVELGKRDYVMNTSLALRPFRRNLTYFGVDLDQLLAANLPLVENLLADLATHFVSGALSPLPYRDFAWHEAGRAFQLMQAAGHIGKILLRPANTPVATVVPPAVFTPGDGVHLVVGGGGGFGFEAAAWLAGRGAKTVVAASRRGAFEPHLEPRAAAIRAAGTVLLADTLDVTDAGAVDALIARLTATHGRVAGIIHAAMVLDDGLITTLDPARVDAVLAPKVAGAANLDRATRGADLDYFAAFSSVAAMVGNPGQAAYVAANGYLQGLMAQRRAAGLPGLAIGFGPIADAGILARDATLAANLGRLTGIDAMPARAALAHFGALLARPPVEATSYVAAFHPGDALQRLHALRSPSFAALFAGAHAIAPAELDLAGRIAGKSDGEARTLVAGLLAAEVARIFRLPAEEIERGRPLDELGLDSMMSLDLRMSIEKRFGVELPVVAITAGVSVNDLAARLVTSLRAGPQPQGDAREQDALLLMQRHGISEAALAEVKTRTHTPRPAPAAALV
jgi:NADPH:quinone reductase-like Zn-dependent oxidoreductase/acyl carrier protein